MTLTVPPWAADAVAELPYPVVFATVSGAHAYGFASVDSGLDLRALHKELIARCTISWFRPAWPPCSSQGRSSISATRPFSKR